MPLFLYMIFLCPFLVRGQVLPTPRSLQHLPEDVVIGAQDRVEIVVGDGVSEKILLAAQMLKESLAEIGLEKNARLANQSTGKGVTIYLWDVSKQKPLPLALSDPDQRLLDPDSHFGQSYLLQTSGSREIWILGSTDQGVLYGVVTLGQLLESAPAGGRVKGVRIRDYPDFRYRASADWLLRAEVNRWGYDWGDGRRAYVDRIKRKLDFCTRFKINMVFFDGFGWFAEKRPGYAALMRELNAYARARGIKLMFGGFGANFDPEIIEPRFGIGRILYNQRGYPHGPIYTCFGESRTATFGTCRSNEALNAEIARELQSFVRAVEPGALYIHHEDTGNYEATQRRWSERCDACKKRWPNADFAAQDGGAGAMAHGYANILRAVQQVKNPDSGYDASRDCTIVFISPVYGVDSARSGMGTARIDVELNWNKTLEFWSNVVSLLPSSDNLEIGFREIFPHPVTGKAWMDAYRQSISPRNPSAKVFVFFLSGADQYSARVFNFPYTGNCTMNGLFKGAEAIYNFNGGLHQEPQQVLNAEFSWNASAPGSRRPRTFRDALATWNALMSNQDLPHDIFGPGELFERACSKIYGMRAGAAMARFFHYYELRQTSGKEFALPRFYPEKIYPTVILWRYLQADSAYWSLRPDVAEQRVLQVLGIEDTELHRRLSLLWQQNAEVNHKAATFVAEASAARDLRNDARDDVEYLARCLVVGEKFAQLLSSYHRFLALRASGNPAAERQRKHVWMEHRQLTQYLSDNFRFDFVDPKGGDQSSWLAALEQIRNHLMESER